MISRLNALGETWVIGETRIPATAASAVPATHVADDTKPGEIPRAAAPRSFCDTAAVTQPMRVYRQTRVSAMVMTTPMPTSQK